MFKIIGVLLILWGIVDTIMSYSGKGDLWYQLFGIILPDPLYQFAGIAAIVVGGLVFRIGSKN